jgi:hypothetical protein
MYIFVKSKGLSNEIYYGSQVVSIDRPSFKNVSLAFSSQILFNCYLVHDVKLFSLHENGPFLLYWVPARNNL